MTGIPAEWRKKVAKVERISELATGLFRAGGGEAPHRPWPHDDMIHGWWVEPPHLLAGEYPGHTDPGRAADKVNLLIDAGIRTFVDLTEEGEWELEAYVAHVEAAAEARQIDVRHQRMPIPDFGVIDDAGYDDILSGIGSARERGAVYVHCWGGRGRTGTVVGCLLASDGIGYDAVMDRMAELRAGTRKGHETVPESDAQREVVRRRAARP